MSVSPKVYHFAVGPALEGKGGASMNQTGTCGPVGPLMGANFPVPLLQLMNLLLFLFRQLLAVCAGLTPIETLSVIAGKPVMA